MTYIDKLEENEGSLCPILVKSTENSDPMARQFSIKCLKLLYERLGNKLMDKYL